jgi:hypothetical protein
MAVWHVFSCIICVSRLGEEPLQGDDVLVCVLRGSGVLRAAVQMVAEGIDGEALARALMMLELL